MDRPIEAEQGGAQLRQGHVAELPHVFTVRPTYFEALFERSPMLVAIEADCERENLWPAVPIGVFSRNTRLGQVCVRASVDGSKPTIRGRAKPTNT